jgi:CubicO group peptidase (beta-lactamase class C family)
MRKLLIFLLSFILTLSAPDWTETEAIIQQGINDGIFSGCVLAVASNNSTFLKKAYGTTYPKKGLYATPMQVGYKFDINRLTQVIGVNTVFMELYDQNTTNITRRVAAILTDFNNNGKILITVDNMLQHNSGFPSDYNDSFPPTPAELLKKIEGLKL